MMPIFIIAGVLALLVSCGVAGGIGYIIYSSKKGSSYAKRERARTALKRAIIRARLRRMLKTSRTRTRLNRVRAVMRTCCRGCGGTYGSKCYIYSTRGKRCYARCIIRRARR